MIERKILGDKFLEFNVSNFIRNELSDVAIKDIVMEKNPLGERITIYSSTPGLIIGREGSNIKKLTSVLKERFNFDNPQIKIGEIRSHFLSAKIVAKMIVNDLSNFGSQKFKLTGFKAMTNIMNAGAMGCEIRISGKLPSARAKTWRFSKGYLKKTGYASDFHVDTAFDSVTLKTGLVGIKVSIMLPDTPLPDKIVYYEDLKSPEMESLENEDEKVLEEKAELEVEEVKEK